MSPRSYDWNNPELNVDDVYAANVQLNLPVLADWSESQKWVLRMNSYTKDSRADMIKKQMAFLYSKYLRKLK